MHIYNLYNLKIKVKQTDKKNASVHCINS